MQSSRATPFADRAPFMRLSITQTPWVSGRLPKPDQRVACLAFDGAVRYVLPFACSCDGQAWHNASTGCALQVQVIGWCRMDVRQ